MDQTDHLRPYRTIQDHTGPYGAIQHHKGPYSAISEHILVSVMLFVCLFVCEFSIHRVLTQLKTSFNFLFLGRGEKFFGRELKEHIRRHFKVYFPQNEDNKIKMTSQ